MCIMCQVSYVTMCVLMAEEDLIPYLLFRLVL